MCVCGGGGVVDGLEEARRVEGGGLRTKEGCQGRVKKSADNLTIRVS